MKACIFYFYGLSVLLNLSSKTFANMPEAICSFTVTEVQRRLQDALLPHDNGTIYGVEGQPNGPGFASELSAIRAAADRFNPLSISIDTEYIGAILEKDGIYYYTAQRGHKGESQVSLHLRYPAVYRLTAFWHTHGAPASERLYFSDYDTKVVEQTGKAFYLADHSGVLKVFNPGGRTLSLMETRRLGLPRKQGYAKGEKVKDRHGEIVVCNTA